MSAATFWPTFGKFGYFYRNIWSHWLTPSLLLSSLLSLLLSQSLCRRCCCCCRWRESCFAPKIISWVTAFFACSLTWKQKNIKEREIKKERKKERETKRESEFLCAIQRETNWEIKFVCITYREKDIARLCVTETYIEGVFCATCRVSERERERMLWPW